MGQVRQNCRATLVIPPGKSVATIVTICCNHRDGEYFLHRITRKLGSTATSTVMTRLLHLTNYRKWDAVGFVRAHQWKYLKALTIGRGHADDGCSCNYREVPPSAIAYQLQCPYQILSILYRSPYPYQQSPIARLWMYLTLPDIIWVTQYPIPTLMLWRVMPGLSFLFPV